jgi:hypothetical protein
VSDQWATVQLLPLCYHQISTSAPEFYHTLPVLPKYEKQIIARCILTFTILKSIGMIEGLRDIEKFSLFSYFH